MKNIKLILVLALSGLFASQAAQALSIAGEIVFSSTGGATLDSTQSTATTVTFGGEEVDLGLGHYSGIASGTAATFSSPFVFGGVGTTGPNAIVDLWKVIVGPTTYSFDLATITINEMSGGSRNLEGLGTAHITGFTSTAGIWSMNFSGASTTVTFSSATHAPVPDSGATSALLGIGLLGLAGAARRFKK